MKFAKSIRGTMILLGVALPVSSFAAAQQLERTANGYRVVYDYADRPAPNNWYVGAKFLPGASVYTEKRGGMGKNEYSNQDEGGFQLGGAAFIGYKLDPNWWLELEGGYAGRYSDYGQGVEIALSAPYAEINATYNMTEQEWGWIYAGVGVGAAFPIKELSGDIFMNGGENKTSVSPLGSIMIGYRTHFEDNWIFDIGYKFMVYDGGDVSRQVTDYEGNHPTFKDDFGIVMNHMVSIGVAYEF